MNRRSALRIMRRFAVVCRYKGGESGALPTLFCGPFSRISSQDPGQAACAAAVLDADAQRRDDDIRAPLLVFGNEPVVFFPHDNSVLIQRQPVRPEVGLFSFCRMDFDLVPMPEDRRQFAHEIGVVGQQPRPVEHENGIEMENIGSEPYDIHPVPRYQELFEPQDSFLVGCVSRDTHEDVVSVYHHIAALQERILRVVTGGCRGHGLVVHIAPLE